MCNNCLAFNAVKCTLQKVSKTGMQKPYRTSPHYRVHQYKGEQWHAHRNPHISLHMAEVQSLKSYIKESLQVLFDAIIPKISQLEIISLF